jgi:hypothetical protein
VAPVQEGGRRRQGRRRVGADAVDQRRLDRVRRREERPREPRPARTGWSVPSRASSPATRTVPSRSGRIAPVAARIPSAIGRSKLTPSFRRSAGARLTVT